MELDDIEKELDDLIALANTTTTELTIRDQVRDNPLTRDQCRDQFVRVYINRRRRATYKSTFPRDHEGRD